MSDIPSWLQRYDWYAKHLLWVACDPRGERADLSGADLRSADLSGANLSGTKDVLDASAWLTANFEQDELGVIVYKRIRNAHGETSYKPPAHWVIEPGSFLTEVCNPLPTEGCGCGVNFATKKWVADNYEYADVWKCRIRWIDLAGTVVPYRTDGKARCARLELLENLGQNAEL
jgi:uncharacterized protein YjbI with pentapeptide repeats